MKSSLKKQLWFIVYLLTPFSSQSFSVSLIRVGNVPSMQILVVTDGADVFIPEDNTLSTLQLPTSRVTLKSQFTWELLQCFVKNI